MIKGDGVREKSPVTWGNGVEEYWNERKWGKNAGNGVCQEARTDRDKWKLLLWLPLRWECLEGMSLRGIN